MALDQEQLAVLLQRIQQGDSMAFRDFYLCTSPVALAILLRIFRSRDAAEDVLQDCFLRVWRSAGSYSRDKGAVISWLATLVRNRAIDAIRRQQGGLRFTDVEDVTDQLVDPSPHIEESLAVSQEFEHMGAALSRLSVGERRSIELTYLAGLSVPEVASQLSVPLGTAKSWVRRGLLKLRTPAALPMRLQGAGLPAAVMAA